MAQHMSAPTTPVLENRYHLDALVYSDSAVVAYHGRDQLLNRPVTVELLRPDNAQNTAFVQRMLDKARSAALANLPHVAALYDQHSVGERPFLVLEELAGPALDDLAPLPTDRALKVVETIAETLEAAIARGEMLPSANGQTIRMHPEGRIQLIDLGLEQTPPDQARAAQTLGRLLTIALGGSADPSRATPPQAIAERAAQGAYPSIAALLADLRHLRQLADTPTTVIPRTHQTIPIPDTAARPAVRSGTAAAPLPALEPAPTASGPSQQRRLLWGIAGAAGLVLLLLLGSLVLGSGDETADSPAPSAIAGESPAPSASGAAAPSGERYVVATNRRQSLTVRSGPSRSFPPIASLPYGTQVEVIEGPQAADGYNWVRIRAANVDGWCIREALRKQ
ncbi:MAG TPA: SH3 domain-containing protein [Herpetosiphonaceae bacterium]